MRKNTKGGKKRNGREGSIFQPRNFNSLTNFPLCFFSVCIGCSSRINCPFRRFTHQLYRIVHSLSKKSDIFAIHRIPSFLLTSIPSPRLFLSDLSLRNFSLSLPPNNPSDLESTTTWKIAPILIYHPRNRYPPPLSFLANSINFSTTISTIVQNIPHIENSSLFHRGKFPYFVAFERTLREKYRRGGGRKRQKQTTYGLFPGQWVQEPMEARRRGKRGRRRGGGRGLVEDGWRESRRH